MTSCWVYFNYLNTTGTLRNVGVLIRVEKNTSSIYIKLRLVVKIIKIHIFSSKCVGYYGTRSQNLTGEPGV